MSASDSGAGMCDSQVARRQGGRPQAAGPPSQQSPHPFAQPASASPGKSNQALHVAQISPPLGSDQLDGTTAGGPPTTAAVQSAGSDALHSAEAAAARASQIAEAAVTAGAAAEEAAADAEDYETASKYAQELLGSLGKPKPSAPAGKRFYGRRNDCLCSTLCSIR